MWKVLTAIVLGGVGAYAGGYIGLAQANESLLDDRVMNLSDIERIANYSLYGAVGVPLGAAIAHVSISAVSNRNFRKRLQRGGLRAVESLGLGPDVGVGVARALDEIDL